MTNNEQVYRRQLIKAEHVSGLVQIDLIDGKFAKNTTIGTDVIGKYPTAVFLEVQLMVEFVQNYIDELVKLDFVTRIIVPYEARSDINGAIYHIKNHNKQVGISLNIETPVKAAFHLFDDIDLLLLLAVRVGFSGQFLDENVMAKIVEAKNIMPGLAIEVDGGVNFANAQKLALKGADFLAANSVLFGADDFLVAYEKLAKVAQIPQ